MKSIEEVLAETKHPSYQDLVVSLGYEIVVEVEDDDYQGYTRLLVRDGERIGVLEYSWGSCSGCDNLQAAYDGDGGDIADVRQSLQDGVVWGTKAELIAHIAEQYLQETDKFCRSDEDTKFAEQATAYLESPS